MNFTDLLESLNEKLNFRVVRLVHDRTCHSCGETIKKGDTCVYYNSGGLSNINICKSCFNKLHGQLGKDVVDYKFEVGDFVKVTKDIERKDYVIPNEVGGTVVDRHEGDRYSVEFSFYYSIPKEGKWVNFTAKKVQSSITAVATANNLRKVGKLKSPKEYSSKISWGRYGWSSARRGYDPYK